MAVDYLETLEFQNPDRDKVAKNLFSPDKSIFFDFKTTTVLKTTAFKISVLKGYQDSVLFHETLAASVIKKGTTHIFKTQSIKGILEFKYTEHDWLLKSIFLFRLVYTLCVIFLYDRFQSKNSYFLAFGTLFHVLMVII